MSLVSYALFPRSMFDLNSWFGPSLDIFDPFDELDTLLGKNFQWLNRPAYLQAAVPRVPRKYRVTLDCVGYNPDTLKTEVKDGKLVVTAKDERKDENGDYSTKEFRKTYNLPENAETEKLVSFVTRTGKMVVEVPLKRELQANEEDLLPKVIDTKDGGKQLTMRCHLPKGIDPSKLSVTCKDRDLIIQAEESNEQPDSLSRMCYYKRCTLPENTDFNNLKCNLEDNRLVIEAPVNLSVQNGRQIPIEFKNSN